MSQQPPRLLFTPSAIKWSHLALWKFLHYQQVSGFWVMLFLSCKSTSATFEWRRRGNTSNKSTTVGNANKMWQVKFAFNSGSKRFAKARGLKIFMEICLVFAKNFITPKNFVKGEIFILSSTLKIPCQKGAYSGSIQIKTLIMRLNLIYHKVVRRKCLLSFVAPAPPKTFSVNLEWAMLL